MRIPSQSIAAKSVIILGFLAICVAPSGLADGISFQLSGPSLSTSSGGTVTFTGTITNDSGGALNASDFFFNFFGFNATSVNPIQDLGVAADFLIANGTTSSVVALFDVTLDSVTTGSSFPIQVQLQDINNDLSAVQTASVSVPGVVATPEPSTLGLLAAGLMLILIAQRVGARSA